MAKQFGAPPQQTHSLKEFGVLVGEWELVGKHQAVPATLKGHATFEWLSENALLVWRYTWDEAIPNAINVIGHDDTAEAATILYTDERGVARIFQTSLGDGVWKMWRDSPGFSQRMTYTVSADGQTINAVIELAREADVWERDMVVSYTRTA